MGGKKIINKNKSHVMTNVLERVQMKARTHLSEGRDAIGQLDLGGSRSGEQTVVLGGKKAGKMDFSKSLDGSTCEPF